MSDRRRMIRVPDKHLFSVLCFSLLWVLSAAAQSPGDWLERMADANEKINYQGTLVHMCDGSMDIVHIVHRVDDGQVTERITARSSGGREIIRNADEVMCILPDQKKVTIEKRGVTSSPLGEQISNFPSFANVSQSLYEITILGSDRVAEQETVVLAVYPVDEYRYGYRLWLDRRTALALKFELVDVDGSGLEQGMFTDIEYSESISAQDVEPTIATDEFEWQRSTTTRGSVTGAAGQASSNTVMSKWHAVTLPPGFELAFAGASISDGADAPMEQLVYSDGLATISIFIEPSVEDDPQPAGMSNIGATHAFTIIRNGYLITAMGGVPPDTARMVAQSVAAR